MTFRESNRQTDETGGDYYDWQRSRTAASAVVMADVTGHGIGPALVAVCRAYASRFRCGPHRSRRAHEAAQ